MKTNRPRPFAYLLLFLVRVLLVTVALLAVINIVVGTIDYVIGSGTSILYNVVTPNILAFGAAVFGSVGSVAVVVGIAAVIDAVIDR